MSLAAGAVVGPGLGAGPTPAERDRHFDAKAERRVQRRDAGRRRSSASSRCTRTTTLLAADDAAAVVVPPPKTLKVLLVDASTTPTSSWSGRSRARGWRTSATMLGEEYEDGEAVDVRRGHLRPVHADVPAAGGRVPVVRVRAAGRPAAPGEGAGRGRRRSPTSGCSTGSGTSPILRHAARLGDMYAGTMLPAGRAGRRAGVDRRDQGADGRPRPGAAAEGRGQVRPRPGVDQPGRRLRPAAEQLAAAPGELPAVHPLRAAVPGAGVGHEPCAPSYPPGATPRIPRPVLDQLGPDVPLDPPDRPRRVAASSPSPPTGDLVLPALNFRPASTSTDPPVAKFEQMSVNLLDADREQPAAGRRPAGRRRHGDDRRPATARPPAKRTARTVVVARRLGGRAAAAGRVVRLHPAGPPVIVSRADR